MQKWKLLAYSFLKVFYLLCFFAFVSMFSFYFFLPGNQGEQNISSVWSHSFPFLFLPILFNILKFDKGQSIARKCKNPTPYMEPEEEQNFNNFFGYFQISEQKINTQSCRDRSASNLTKGFPWWFDVIAPFKNMLKVWLQFHLCQKWSHLTRPLLLLLCSWKFINYELHLRICRHVFSLQRGSNCLLFVLWCVPIQQNEITAFITSCAFQALDPNVLKQAVLFVCVKNNISPHLTPLLFSWGLL